MLIGIDVGRVERLSNLLKKRSIEHKRLNAFDERFYPSKNSDAELTARYFLVMVSMDHRLSRPGAPYEACIEGECFHGSDLLYRLGKLALDRDPDFFSPESLARMTTETVERWLSAGSARPVDAELRAYLLRDLGQKLSKLYGGRALELLELSEGRVRGRGPLAGIVDLLRPFRAYEDPVEKKAMLLVKFLAYRGLFKPIDSPDLPIDNHLTRIALRLGIVMVSGDLWDKVKRGIEVSSEEDVLIRTFARRAFRLVVERSGVDPLALDDYLWSHGREVCARDKPVCERCALRSACLGYSSEKFLVNEHAFYSTWYY